MVHKHQSKSSSRIADRTRALIRVHGTVPALPSGGQARPAASERCEHGLFCAHACRKKCSGVSGGHGGIARAGGPGQRAMVRPHEALRCRSCRSKISPGTLAAYHCADSQPRTRPRSIKWTGKVAGIGASGRPSGGTSRLESREGGKSGLPPVRAWS
jgi:hypothetical protein